MPPQPTVLPTRDLNNPSPPPDSQPPPTENPSQTSALFIVLGVLLGVGMLAILFWCVCYRGSTRRGRSRRRRSGRVRVVRYPGRGSSEVRFEGTRSPVTVTGPTVSETMAGGVDGLGAGGHGAEVQEPPRSYQMYDDGVRYVEHGVGSPYLNEGFPDWAGNGERDGGVVRPWARVATTNLPLPDLGVTGTTDGESEADGGPNADYQSPRCETSSAVSSTSNERSASS